MSFFFRSMASSHWWLCGVCKAVHWHQKYSCITAFFLRDIWTSDKKHTHSFCWAQWTEVRSAFAFSTSPQDWDIYTNQRHCKGVVSLQSSNGGLGLLSVLFSTSCRIWFNLWDSSILIQMKQFDTSKLSKILWHVPWHVNPSPELR